MRDSHGPWRPPPVSPAPSPVPPVPSPLSPDPRLSLQRGDARGQEAFTKAASLHPPSFHPSFSPSLHPSMSPSFQPFTLPSSSPRGEFHRLTTAKLRFLIKNKRKIKNPPSVLNSQSPSPALSPRAPRGHSKALPGTRHSQAETISSSLVRNGRVYLSQPLILLTLLLFGP